jgi:hypothetical protein
LNAPFEISLSIGRNNSLKEIINHQTTVIESTKAEILEVKHDQNVLRDQNEKLHE